LFILWHITACVEPVHVKRVSAPLAEYEVALDVPDLPRQHGAESSTDGKRNRPHLQHEVALLGELELNGLPQPPAFYDST
jgi:hypothetical protein